MTEVKSLHHLSQILKFPVILLSSFAEILDIRFIIRHNHGYPLHYTSRPWISASLHVRTLVIRFTTMDIRFITRHDHGYSLHKRHDHGYPLHYTSRPWISASLHVTTTSIRFLIRHDHLLIIFVSFTEKLCD